MIPTTASASPTRGTRMPRAQREEQILAVAETVFAERGYQATTMEDVAERVGVTKPLIYEYFGSKEGLLSACVDKARTQLRDATVTAWQGVPGCLDRDLLRERDPRLLRLHRRPRLRLRAHPAGGCRRSLGQQRHRGHSNPAVGGGRRDPAAGPRTRGPPAAHLEGYAEVVIGACERVAVWRLGRRDQRPGRHQPRDVRGVARRRLAGVPARSGLTRSDASTTEVVATGTPRAASASGRSPTWPDADARPAVRRAPCRSAEPPVSSAERG